MDAKKIQDPVFLDTETTGLYRSSEIIEIAVVDANQKPLLESLVRPSGPIPPAATAVHGITDKMVANAPPWPELWPRLQQLLAGRAVGIYNAPFDTRMIRQTVERHKLTWSPPGGQLFCVMSMYRRYFAELGRGKAKTYKLEVACRHFGIDVQQTHGALVDAQLTAGVFARLAGRPAPRPPAAAPTPALPATKGAPKRMTNASSPNVELKMPISVARLLASAANRLQARDAASVMRIAAMMEHLLEAADLAADLDRLEALLYYAADETAEIDQLRRNLGM